jgi:hypothetical protein
MADDLSGQAAGPVRAAGPPYRVRRSRAGSWSSTGSGKWREGGAVVMPGCLSASAGRCRPRRAAARPLVYLS